MLKKRKNVQILKNSILGIAIAILLFGCAAKGPKFQSFEKPKKGKSLIYIYRNNSIMGAGVTPNIHKIDLESKEDQVIGSVKKSGYIKTEIDNDIKYEIWAQTEAKNEVNIDSNNSTVYCIEHYITPGFFVGHPQFKKIPLDKCEVEIKKTKLSIDS